jgi:hypothetical protein
MSLNLGLLMVAFSLTGASHSTAPATLALTVVSVELSTATGACSFSDRAVSFTAGSLFSILAYTCLAARSAWVFTLWAMAFQGTEE